MSQWVRLWEDMPNDPKWRLIARRAIVSDALPRVTVRDVVSVFVQMLICAGTAKNRGSLDGWNDEVVAVSLDAEPELVRAIREAMDGLVLDGNRLRSWEKRQPNREDSSTERVRALRAKRNAVKHSETSLQRSETQRNAPEEKRRESESNSLRSLVARPRAKTTQQVKSKIRDKEEPTESQIAAARAKGLTETERIAEWGKFKNFNQAKGTEFDDWDAAWRMWLGKIKPQAEQTGGALPNGWVPTKRIGDRTFRVGEPAPKYGGQPPQFWEPLTAEDCR
jgi:hypothetical protein